MANMQFIEAFLAAVEGPRMLRGYVPSTRLADGKGRNYIGPAHTPANGVAHPACGHPAGFRAMGASGVTIATGCDLGQTDASALARFGLAREVIDLYAPYFGQRKSHALAALFARPLLISQAAADATDLALHKGYLDSYVRPAWERASGKSFDAQPDEAQAVIMSVCYQKGCAGVARDWPKLWNYLTACDWQGAARELLTGFKQYRQRRQAEGRLLARLP